MMKQLIKSALRQCNVEVGRPVDPELPLQHALKIAGRPHSFWLVNRFTKDWWQRPEIECSGEFAYLSKLAKFGDTVVEIGAHHGMMTLLLSDQIGSEGHVYAIEAEPFNLMTLQANCFSNQVRNVSTFHCAVGDHCGRVDFGGESLAAQSGTVRKVVMTTLGEFAEQSQIEFIDLLKIDVEGYETQVLRGAGSLLKKIPRLAIELHLDLLQQAGSSLAEFWSLLETNIAVGDKTVIAIQRPDWNTGRPITSITDLPDSGVVNLFISNEF
ncbi:hypothetical protein SV7mr_33280 [Stieleria bergensis]|uniref:Methyltransferase FkbM domain-containing protein n=1 Tax=Stieleria bergensis TaxID=2528025 RepID=A0A517SXP8_9BACT|nr:MAG: hypothetical protein CBB71_22870 [Rhodopirellula sp. TMED11]QDT60801.1 hypothetical protein SV7mr_33280 [Planctomycetes bacterium SV_7m_r]